MLADRTGRRRSLVPRSARAAVAAGLGLAAAVSLTAAPATAADQAAQLAIAVPLVVPAGETGLIEAPALAQYTREGGLLDRQLDAVLGREVALGIDPMIIVSIRILGTAAPPTATAWLDRLENADNETFALAYADTDITLATQGGASVVPQPEGFQFAVDPALFAPVDQPEATPAPTPDPDVPVLPPLPNDEDLVAWPYTLPGIAWPRENTMIGTDLNAIVTAGYRTTIVSSDNLDRNGRRAAASVTGTSVAVSDSTVSSALREAATAGALDVTALTAAITSAGRDGAILATMDRGIPISGRQLGEVLDALSANPAIELVPLSRALGQAPDEASIVDRPQPADRVQRAADLIDSDAATRRFAVAAENPALIIAAERLTMLALLSNAWADNPDGWATASDAARAAASALRESVQVVDTSSFLLVADNNQYLPVTVSNALDQPVTVFVNLRPTTGRLVVLEQSVQLVVAPQSQSRVEIPVQSIANGETAYVVTLSDSLGGPVGNQTFGRVNVQAGWETPIVLVLAGVVVLVFAAGVVRTVLRRRRDRAAEGAP